MRQAIASAVFALCTVVLTFQTAVSLDAIPHDLAALNKVCEQVNKDDAVMHGCVAKVEGEWVIVDPSGEAGRDCAASGTFIDSSHTVSNFGKLRIVTEANYSDVDQAFAAGYLEGYLTAARIYDHHSNLKAYFDTMLNESESLVKALDWLEVQEVWANTQIAAAAPNDTYWQLLGLIQAQFDGLVAGYQARARAAGAGPEQQQQGGQGQPAGGVGARRLAGLGKGGGGSSGGDVEVGWLERRDLMFLNSNGDVYDIIDAMEAGYGNTTDASGDGGDDGDGDDGASLTRGAAAGEVGASQRQRSSKWDVDPDPMRMSLRLGLQGKCSALIKVTGDLGELLLGHSTHDSYTAMTRIYKHYDFSGLANPAVVAQQVSFSSYPGELFSDDDFYLLSSGLAVMETTNHIYVPDVFAALQPHVVLSWQRLRLANWMAGSGEEWVELFGRHNSGTYNNQYMILDAKRFVPHSELQPGLLWVVEQLPGILQTADMTDELSRGYWPSYNVAYFPEVYDAAGYPDMIERLAQEGAKKYAFSIRMLRYQIAPRAAIFRRDQGAVDSLEALKGLMRYNDWQHDPYAENNPVGAVCARGDLAKGDAAIAKGCYDSKVTSASMLLRMESEVVGGPTAQGQPAFSWTDPRFSGLPHRGMPDTFDFSFERMSPRDLPTHAECAAAAAAASTTQHPQQQQDPQQQQPAAATDVHEAAGAGRQAAGRERVSLLLPRKAGRGGLVTSR